MPIPLAELGVRVVVSDPRDLSVWYAPETLLWVFVIAVGPAALLLALRPLVVRLLAETAQENRAEAKESYQEQRRDDALADPRYADVILAFVYALIVGNVCGVAAHGEIAARPPAGLTAAATLLLLPAVAFFCATILALGLAYLPIYRLGGEATLLLWLYCGAFGCAFTSMFAAEVGWPAAVAFLALAAAQLASALRLRLRRGPSGETLVTRARHLEIAKEREYASQAADEAPDEGTYLGRSPTYHWGRIALAFLFPFALFFGFFLATGWDWSLVLTLVVFCLGVGSAAAILFWLLYRRAACSVRWDREGIEVVWFVGPPKFFRWEDLRTLRLGDGDEGSGRSPGGAVVTMSTGDRFRTSQSGINAEPLHRALVAQVWGHEKDVGA
jgi:hypothetical protein